MNLTRSFYNMFISKIVLVIGNADFIGSHAVNRLVSEGYSVRMLDNLYSDSIDHNERHLCYGAVNLFKGLSSYTPSVSLRTGLPALPKEKLVAI